MQHNAPNQRNGRKRNARRLNIESLEARRVLDASGLADWFANDPVETSYQPNQLLLQLEDPAQSPPDIGLEGVSYSLTSRAGLYKVDTPSSEVANQALSLLASATGVEYVEPNHEYTISTGDRLVPDDLSPALWGMDNFGQNFGVADADIDGPEAWFHVNDATSVVVADIDTGVDYTHPDLYLNIWINQGEIPATRLANLTDVDSDGVITFWDLNDPVNIGPGRIEDLNSNGYIDGGDLLEPMLFINGEDGGIGGWEDMTDNDANSFVDDLVGWDFVNNDNDPIDDHNHGTHTVGTIAGIGDNGEGVVGVAWKARVIALKFLSNRGSGSSLGGANSISYASAMGADISSNSWGGYGFSTTIRNAIRDAETVDHLVIAAAGNDNIDNDAIPHYPSSYDEPNVIGVASSTRTDGKSGFSNFGLTSVDLAAPGSSIRSTVVGGGYASFSGTSMATPHVAGAAALVAAIQPTYDYAQIKARLLDTVDPVAEFSGLSVTGGRLNAHDAVFFPPPVDPTDILVNDVVIQGSNAVVSYEIQTTVADEFELALMKSSDGGAESATPLGSVMVSDPADLAIGVHSFTIPLGSGAGQVPLPGLGAPEDNTQYTIMAVADPADLVAEQDATPVTEDNFAVAVGSYLGDSQVLYALGGPDNDVIRITDSGSDVQVTVNGDLQSYPLASVANVRARGGAGNDDIDGSGASPAIWASGGPGADALNGGDAADEIYGDEGVDQLRFIGSDANEQITFTQGAGGGPVLGILNKVRDMYHADSTDTYLIDGRGGNDRISIRTTVNYPSATILGGEGNDTLTGGLGNDLIQGGPGRDSMDGGDGSNMLDGGEGDLDLATVRGTNEADHLVLRWNSVEAVLEGVRLVDGIPFWISQIVAAEKVTLSGLGGEDLLDASSMDTAAIGAANLQNLTLAGGDDNDTLLGSEGRDTIQGNDGDDTLSGFGDRDNLNGGDGNDTLNGGPDNDKLVGGTGDDELNGDAGNDSLAGGPGSDQLSGGVGRDGATIGGTDEADSMVVTWDVTLLQAYVTTGPLGPAAAAVEIDTIVDIDNITLSGKDGDDVIDARAMDANVRATLGLLNVTLSGGDGGDEIHGTAGVDSINGGDGDDMLFGYDGNDKINGGAGSDEMSGGEGADQITGSTGDDILNGDGGNDKLNGGEGSDEYSGGLGNDGLSLGGTDGDDAIVMTWDDALPGALVSVGPRDGSSVTEVDTIRDIDKLTLSGGDGNDLIDASTITGGNLAQLGLNNPVLSGGDGNDEIRGGGGLETINGGDGNDLLFGGNGRDKINGGNDDDVIYGEGDNDFLIGAAGNDVIFGGKGADKLVGTSGLDVLVGNEGNDTLTGGIGAITIMIGGAGRDQLTGRELGDLLIGGSTDHDADVAALQAIMAEWSRGDLGYADRIDHLRGTVAGGLNGGVLLNDTTVSDDADRDKMQGREDLDWFWGDVAIDDLDIAADEQLN